MVRAISLLTVMLFAVIAGQAQALDRGLGPISITGDQTLVLHFLNLQPGSSTQPISVEAKFFNAQSVLVATGNGSCEGDQCLVTDSILVESGRTASVFLSGASLGLAATESMTIQPVISTSGLGVESLLTVLEVIGQRAPFRFALQYGPRAVATALPPPSNLSLGPLMVQRGELARFTVGLWSDISAPLHLHMFFLNSQGAAIGPQTIAELSPVESASIELDGDALDLAGIPGPVTAELRPILSSGESDLPIRGVGFSATLQIIDKSTGAVKAIVDTGGSVSSNGRGGGGGAP
jgi:hypothetical protein